MKKKNQEKIASERRLEVIRRHYDVDEANKVIRLDLRYATAEELIANDTGYKTAPLVKGEVIERIDEVMSLFPPNYKVKVDISVVDFGETSAEELLLGFNDTLEMRHYQADRANMKRWLLAMVLVSVGFFILLTNAVLTHTNVLSGETMGGSLISEILDITAWVFVWESVSTMFLERNEEHLLAMKFRFRLSSISFFLEGEKSPRASESGEDIFAEWTEERPVNRAGRRMMLYSGTATIALGLFGFANGIVAIYKGAADGKEAWYYALIIIAEVLALGIHAMFGASAISRFRGKGPFYKAAPVFAILSLVFGGVLLGLAISQRNASMIVSSAFSLLSLFGFGFGYILSRIVTKRK